MVGMRSRTRSLMSWDSLPRIRPVTSTVIRKGSVKGQSTILALRCFEWVIASWADLAESAALRLFKVEAGIKACAPPAAGPLHLIRFSLEQTSLRAGEVARFGVRQIDRSLLALIYATLNVSGPEQIAGSGGMMGCYDTG